MGMYTSVDLELPLKLDTPKNVVDFLDWMVNPDTRDESLSHSEQALVHYGVDHEFFKSTDWASVFWGSSGKRFTPPTILKLDAGNYKLGVRGGVKNSSQTVKLFAEWISPYVEASPETELGEWIYEEWHGWSTIRMGADGQLIMKPWREPEPQGMW